MDPQEVLPQQQDQRWPKKRTPGRSTKYDWEDKKDICHKLYVEEQKTANEIIQYFAEHFNADPSALPGRKAFLHQFQQWGFPTHGNTLSPETETAASARIRELWEQNINQKDIKVMMDEEGWNLKAYDFTKLWKKNGLRLRNEHGYKPPSQESKKRKRTRAASTAAAEQSAEEISAPEPALEPISAPMDAEEAAVRVQRLQEIQLESDQRLENRKRRRRIRGYGHLPPDAPGTAPRYASETSLDECKAYLGLDNETYVNIRKEYTAICEAYGILKKTQAPEGMWEESKRRLIRENPHLSVVMEASQPDIDKKNVALECLAADVTKRMRVTGRAITIADANNILDLNPAESKAVRRAFYEILAADKFESRLVSGEAHWNELRELWFTRSEKLQHVVAEKDPQKLRALDLLCRDTMKRFREDRNSRGERVVVQQNAEYGPGPGPAWAAKAPRTKRKTTIQRQSEHAEDSKETIELDQDVNDVLDERLLIEPHVRAVMEAGKYPPQPHGNLITTMAQATGDIDFDLDPALAGPGHYTDPIAAAPVADMGTNFYIPVFFRLAPESQIIGEHPEVWLGKLAATTMDHLHAAAMSKLAEGANVRRIHGLMKNGHANNSSWLIEGQDELQAYLDAAGDKATFLVVLAGMYNSR